MSKIVSEDYDFSKENSVLRIHLTDLHEEVANLKSQKLQLENDLYVAQKQQHFWHNLFLQSLGIAGAVN